MRTSHRWYFLLSLLLIAGLGFVYLRSLASPTASAQIPHATTPIQHVVIVMMENHTFDSYFGRFPGVRGITLPQASNPLRSDYGHTRPALLAAMDGGKMDQFPSRSFVQYTQADIPRYWSYAQQFGLSDNFFSSIAAGSTPNHIAMIASQTGGVATTLQQEGCFSTPNNLAYSQNAATGASYWSYPCYDINSIPELLQNSGLTWRYYNENNLWDAPQFIKPIAGSPDDVHNSRQFLTDVQTGNLPTVAFLDPSCGSACDHPPAPTQGAQNFLVDTVNAVMKSPYWANTAIFVSWDDWGGFYDHIVPPQLDALGLGPRVPLLVISPYAKHGYISHALGEFSSFDKYIEQSFNLKSLGQRDAIAQVGNLMDFFDFSQTPQPPFLLTDISYSNAIAVNQPSLVPAIGGSNTDFKFSITYTQKITPAIHNVTIDGVSHSMFLSGNSQGKLYQYVTKLGVGTHHYTFTFTDANGGTLTIPYNGVPFPGPEVHPFSVSGLNIIAPLPLPGQPVTASAKYTSPANKAPILAEVDVDGVPHPMTLTKGSDFTAGVFYSYKTTTLSLGVHYFRYRFDDGSGVATYESVKSPPISNVFLSHSSLSPAAGPSSTVFTFQVTYVDQNGETPSMANLYVDNTAYPMTRGAGSNTTGVIYSVRTTLPVGNHTYAFVFADSTTSWAEPISAAMFAGPNVGPNAKPNDAGTLVLPDHLGDPEKDDPDGVLDQDSPWGNM